MTREIELVNQRSHADGVDPPSRGDQAGSDFDDETHSVINLTSLAWFGQSAEGTQLARPPLLRSRRFFTGVVLSVQPLLFPIRC